MNRNLYWFDLSFTGQIAGTYHWKHGRKGSGVYWLQQARDEVRLNKIAQRLFECIGKSISDDSFKVCISLHCAMFHAHKKSYDIDGRKFAKVTLNNVVVGHMETTMLTAFFLKTYIFCSWQQWEGLIELLGSQVGTAGGLEFLHKYYFVLSLPFSSLFTVLSSNYFFPFLFFFPYV